MTLQFDFHDDFEKWDGRLVLVTEGPHKGRRGTVEMWITGEDPQVRFDDDPVTKDWTFVPVTSLVLDRGTELDRIRAAVLDPNNACPDMEICEGMILLEEIDRLTAEVAGLKLLTASRSSEPISE